ncbi:hypothetical protein P5V15_005864 [Pogonomyrmex californicus]
MPGRPASATNEEDTITIRCTIICSESTFLRIAFLRIAFLRIAPQQHNIDKSVHTILKHVKFHPYKIKLVQEFNDNDPDRRLEFCDLMMERIDADPNFLFNIVFSDEAIFELNGQVNRLQIEVIIILIGCWKATLNIHKN